MQSPKIAAEETGRALDDAMFGNHGSSSSSYSQPASDYDSSSSDSSSNLDPKWDFKTTDENGYERKLRETGFNTYEDDQGNAWERTGIDTVARSN